MSLDFPGTLGAQTPGEPGTTPAAAPQGNTLTGTDESNALFADLFSGSPAPAAPGGAAGVAAPPAGAPAAPGAAPASGQEPGTPPAAPPAWLEKLPEELRKHPALQDKASPEDVLKDYLKLKDTLGNYKPLEKAEELKLKLPEGLDPKLANQFGGLDFVAKKAVELKMSPEQAQGAFEAFQQYQNQEWNALNKNGQEAIQSMWGKDFTQNKDSVGKALSMLGSRMGPDGSERLKAWVQGHPIVGSSPVFAEMMLTIARSVSEEALPAGPGAPAGGGGAMTDTAYLKSVTGWQE